MAVLWMTQFLFVVFNTFLIVVANKDFCGSIFETQVGVYALIKSLVFFSFSSHISYSFHVDHFLGNNVMKTTAVVDEFECQLKCMGNNSCKSCNVHPGDNNANRI